MISGVNGISSRLCGNIDGQLKVDGRHSSDSIPRPLLCILLPYRREGPLLHRIANVALRRSFDGGRLHCSLSRSGSGHSRTFPGGH